MRTDKLQENVGSYVAADGVTIDLADLGNLFQGRA